MHYCLLCGSRLEYQSEENLMDLDDREGHASFENCPRCGWLSEVITTPSTKLVEVILYAPAETIEVDDEGNPM